jgi:hypothetical protein
MELQCVSFLVDARCGMAIMWLATGDLESSSRNAPMMQSRSR